ncbi:hypothetical protein LSAT2_008096, partial [Lamellibrachia satsuma]
TGPTGGEVAPTDVNQSGDVRTPTEVADKEAEESTEPRVWRRHRDHIRVRIPEENDGDAGSALSLSTGVPAFMGEKKARGVQAPPLVRSSVTTVDHPVGVTGPTGGEVAPTDVNQSSEVRTPTEVANKEAEESTEP